MKDACFIPDYAVKLSTAAQMREFDRRAIEEYGIPGIVLMENAGRHVYQVVYDILVPLAGQHVTVIAGKGNNGGDGFVAARHLRDAGACIDLFLIGDPSSVKGDARINLDILLKTGMKVNTLNSISDLDISLERSHAVIDAIFGTGLKGDVTGLAADVIDAVNSCGKPVIAVDIPSGLDADTGRIWGTCVEADYTVTFALPKIGLFTYPGADYAGKVVVGDIGIPHQLYDSIDVEIISGESVSNRLPDRSGSAHKGTFGTTVVIAGSRGMTGAAAMASEAALRIGAGLSVLCVPTGIQDIMAVKLTEVMTRGLPETAAGTLSSTAVHDALSVCGKSASVVLGCGLGFNDETCRFVWHFVPAIEKPLVIDADGLNCLAENPDTLNNLHNNVILTPHPGEMARLLGTTTADIQSNRLEAVKQAVSRFKCVVVLKGAGTLVAGPDGKIFHNITGNPGMATGGTGDVLAGTIGGLLSQGLSPVDAAVCGVYLHGSAGDIAACKVGIAGMLAGDLLCNLPEALNEFYSS
ncbi:MAG: NAD(P)H-hydrate dehydratase [Armatimonadota bacterium]